MVQFWVKLAHVYSFFHDVYTKEIFHKMLDFRDHPQNLAYNGLNDVSITQFIKIF